MNGFGGIAAWSGTLSESRLDVGASRLESDNIVGYNARGSPPVMANYCRMNL